MALSQCDSLHSWPLQTVALSHFSQPAGSVTECVNLYTADSVKDLPFPRLTLSQSVHLTLSYLSQLQDCSFSQAASILSCPFFTMWLSPELALLQTGRFPCVVFSQTGPFPKFIISRSGSPRADTFSKQPHDHSRSCTCPQQALCQKVALFSAGLFTKRPYYKLLQAIQYTLCG